MPSVVALRVEISKHFPVSSSRCFRKSKSMWNPNYMTSFPLLGMIRSSTQVWFVHDHAKTNFTLVWSCIDAVWNHIHDPFACYPFFNTNMTTFPLCTLIWRVPVFTAAAAAMVIPLCILCLPYWHCVVWKQSASWKLWTSTIVWSRWFLLPW